MLGRRKSFDLRLHPVHCTFSPTKPHWNSWCNGQNGNSLKHHSSSCTRLTPIPGLQLMLFHCEGKAARHTRRHVTCLTNNMKKIFCTFLVDLCNFFFPLFRKVALQRGEISCLVPLVVSTYCGFHTFRNAYKNDSIESFDILPKKCDYIVRSYRIFRALILL